MPVESQQPKAQLLGVHFAGPQETPIERENPSTAPSAIHLKVVVIVCSPHHVRREKSNL